ncbi:hypothetical protein SO802_015598 [Lithocarpus litseifolius]|uniref:RNase H type-1 domain-containing protein n=1 Tax=Lithocarpus litseifolius TaxID=425828 RepID=A0AAW2CWF0_9ROSI
MRMQSMLFGDVFQSRSLPDSLDAEIFAMVTHGDSWISPFHAPFKINFNEALFKDISASGLRVVICNNQWEAIGAMLEKISLPYSMVDMEALACRRVVIFAQELSIIEAEVEGDSTMVIDFISFED